MLSGTSTYRALRVRLAAAVQEQLHHAGLLVFGRCV
jgi:hypothetical protein